MTKSFKITTWKINAMIIITIKNVNITIILISFITFSFLKIFKSLNFVNFYRRFIIYLSQLFVLLFHILKKMQNEIKKKYFLFTLERKKTFHLLWEVFQYVFILIYLNSEFFIKLKIDALNYKIVYIIF